MKADLDSIIYIVITIAILVISALGRRKKKPAGRQAGTSPNQAEQAEDQDIFEPVEEEPVQTVPPRASQSQNPFDRLEQFLTGQFQEATGTQARASQEEYTEANSLEELVDEEEVIMDQIRRDREELYRPKDAEKKEDTSELSAFKQKEVEKSTLPELFSDSDEITKAIIYSEILKRKYN